MEKIMMDGEPLEVGDEVYCLLNGKGKVASINEKITFSIVVSFSDGPYTYSKKFKGWSHQKNRTLYWQKPEIIPPPKLKPKKKIKVCDYFVEWPCGSIFEYRRVEDTSKFLGAKVIQKIDGTEREIEVEG